MAIGVLEWPAVGSSVANSPFVELTTYKTKNRNVKIYARKSDRRMTATLKSKQVRVTRKSNQTFRFLASLPVVAYGTRSQ